MPQGLAAEIGLAVIRPEVRPDHAVGIEGDEFARGTVVTGDDAVAPDMLENIPSGRGIPEFLCLPQVLLLGDRSELTPVFLIMIDPFLA